jgi:hypothetical protein
VDEEVVLNEDDLVVSMLSDYGGLQVRTDLEETAKALISIH